MRTAVPFVAGLVALWTSGASAQQVADNLNDVQRHGRQLLAQSCGVCHLPPSLNARSYGPPLNSASGNNDDALLREYIESGTPRMPGFKLHLKSAEIDAIIAYVRTVPASQSTPAGRRPE